MPKLNKVEIIGAGPAGLYLSILLKSRFQNCWVRVTEQNPQGSTFGFGVVFSDQALGFLDEHDPKTNRDIEPLMQRWRNMTLSVKGERVELDGIGFASIGRLDFLKYLQSRALQLGVDFRYNSRVETLADVDSDADLIVGADGLNSIVRKSHEQEFGMELNYFTNYFAWFGAPMAFDNLTQTFIETTSGALNAHHYRYSANMSTFIVECQASKFEGLGFNEMDEVQSSKHCSQLFSSTLKGKTLLTNQSRWRQFPRLWCKKWVFRNKVLTGDAAHTAHFSIGSGTRLALEDAIALAACLDSNSTLDNALGSFEENRQPIAQKIVSAANTSAEWYENFESKLDLPAMQFAYDYLKRSGRLSDEKLSLISPGFMKKWRAQ